jgi:hypothetical protein
VCSVKLSGTPLERFINIDEFLTMSEEQIRMKFKGSTLGMRWLKPETLRRNALMAKGG